MLLHIEASKDRTHKNQSDEVFLRVGDEDKKLSFEQRLQMEYDKGERSFEDKIIPECTLDDLDDQVLDNYQLAVNYGGDDILKLLKARGFANPKNDDVQITNAGVLLFAKYPTTFLPNARVRFIKYEGSKAEATTHPSGYVSDRQASQLNNDNRYEVLFSSRLSCSGFLISRGSSSSLLTPNKLSRYWFSTSR